jgi:hypothetical protein
MSAQAPASIAAIQFVAQVGTHTQRLGVQAMGLSYKNKLQASLGAGAYYNFKQLGPKGHWLEYKLQAGVATGINTIASSYEYQQTLTANSVLLPSTLRCAYHYNIYGDTRGTAQHTGSIKIAYKKVEFITENDALAFRAFDRYRTGGILVNFIDSQYTAGVKLVLWTGFSNKAPKLLDSLKNRFVDIANAPMGKHSHGILAANIALPLMSKQYAHAEIGVDDESIRDFFQNKLVHQRTPFNRKNQTRVPQLDANGNSRIYANQSKRPSRLFANFGFNTAGLY